MKKVLMVTTISRTLQDFIFPFVEHFRSLGWLVDGMACDISSDAKCLAIFDRVWDVEISRNPLDPKNFFQAPETIRQAMAEREYDIVHVHTPVAALIVRYALNDLRKRNQVKVIYTAHGFHFHRGSNPLTNPIFIGLEKLAGAWTDYLVVINHDDEQAAQRYHFLPSDRIRYMPGIGVDINIYNRSQVTAEALSLFRQEIGVSPETPLFLAVAELVSNKRHQDMIRALVQLDRSDVHLICAGVGPLLDDLNQLVAELGVQERVHFLGHRRDIPMLLCSSTAMLLVSRREGLPRSIMEALCLSIPVVGTNIRGTSDLLADNSGLLMEVGDIDALTMAMAWILDHPQEAKEMAERGKQRMSDYGIQHILDLYTKLYYEALDKVED
jgi:glycosyltransferase involved in cell wall biosynthesis